MSMHPAYHRGHAAGLVETIARKLVSESEESRVTLAAQVFDPDTADPRLVIASEMPGIKHVGRRVTFGENITPSGAANYMIALTPNEETPFLFSQISAGTGEYAVNGPWYAFTRPIQATDTYDNSSFTNVRVKGTKLTIDNTAAFQAGGNIAGLISGGIVANPPSPAQYSFTNLTSLDSNSMHTFLQRPIFTASSSIRLPSLGPLRNTIKRRDMGEISDVYDWDFSNSRDTGAAPSVLNVFSTMNSGWNAPSTWLWPGTWGNPQLDLSGTLTLAANFTASPPLCMVALVYSDSTVAGSGANAVFIPIPLVAQYAASSIFSMSAHLQLRDYLPDGFELAPILGFMIRLTNDGGVPLTALRINGGSTIRLNNGRYRERDLILGYMALSGVPQSFVVRSTSTVDLVMDRAAERSFGDIVEQQEVIGDVDLLNGMANRIISNGGLALAYRGDPDQQSKEFLSIVGAASQHGHAFSLGDLWKGVKRAAQIIAPAARPLINWAGNEAIKRFVPSELQEYATKGLQSFSGMAASNDRSADSYDMAGHAQGAGDAEEKATAVVLLGEPIADQPAPDNMEVEGAPTAASPVEATTAPSVLLGTPPDLQWGLFDAVMGTEYHLFQAQKAWQDRGIKITMQPSQRDDMAGHAASFNDGTQIPDGLTFRLIYSLILGVEVKATDEELAKLDGANLDVWFQGHLVRKIAVVDRKVVELAAGRAAGVRDAGDYAGHASGKRDRMVVRPAKKRFRTPERPGGSARQRDPPGAPRKPKQRHDQPLSQRLSDIEGRLAALEYTMLAPAATPPFAETVEAEPEFHETHGRPLGPDSGLEGKAAGREQDAHMDLGSPLPKRQRVPLPRPANLAIDDDELKEGSPASRPPSPPDGPVLQQIRVEHSPVLDRTLDGAASRVSGDFFGFRPDDCPVPIDCASLCVNAGSEAIAALTSTGAFLRRFKPVFPGRAVKWFVKHRMGCLKDYTECDCCIVPVEGDVPPAAKAEGHAASMPDPSRFSFASFGAASEAKGPAVPQVSRPPSSRTPFPNLLAVLRDRALLQASTSEVSEDALCALALQPWLDRANVEAVARGGFVNGSPLVPGLGRAAYCGVSFPAPAKADVLGFGTVIVSPFQFNNRINLGAVQTILPSEYQTHTMAAGSTTSVTFKVDAGSEESKAWWATKFFPWVDKNQTALRQCALVKRLAAGRLGSWGGESYPNLYVYIIRNNLSSIDGTSSFGAIWAALSGLPAMGLVSSDMDSGVGGTDSLSLLPVVMIREKVWIASRLGTNLIICAASSDQPNALPVVAPFLPSLEKARNAKPELYLISDVASFYATLEVLAATLSDQGSPDFVRTLVTNVDEAHVTAMELKRAEETKGYQVVKAKLDGGRISQDVFDKKLANMMKSERTPLVAATREWNTNADEAELVTKLMEAIANLQTLPKSTAQKNLAARGSTIIAALRDPKTPMKSKVERVYSFIASVNNTVASAATAGTGKKKGGAEAQLKAATAALAALRGAPGPQASAGAESEETGRKRGRTDDSEPANAGGFAESQE